jgi:hypothetical protein
MSDFQKFLLEWQLACTKHPELRTGQAAFNVLHVLHPELSMEINGRIIDPFNDNRNIPGFLEHVFNKLEGAKSNKEKGSDVKTI